MRAVVAHHVIVLGGELNAPVAPVPPPHFSGTYVAPVLFTPMKAGKKPIANPLVVLREEFDDWAVLFDPDSGNAFGLSPTGVYLWKCLDGGHTLDVLLQRIRNHADNVPEGISDHIKAFVDALVAQGFAGLDITGLAPRPSVLSLPSVAGVPMVFLGHAFVRS
jgi:SynChlorMet cassette protein ScmD